MDAKQADTHCSGKLKNNNAMYYTHSHKVPGSIGSRYGVEGRHLKKCGTKGVYPFGTTTQKLVRDPVAFGSMTRFDPRVVDHIFKYTEGNLPDIE